MPQSPSPSILIVEDEVHVREMLADLFEADGYAVRMCSNGQRALAMLEEEPVALVISDLIMPECDGLELQLELRKRWPDTLFIAISAPNNFSSLEASAGLGATATYEKPLDLDEMRATVRRLMVDWQARFS